MVMRDKENAFQSGVGIIYEHKCQLALRCRFCEYTPSLLNTRLLYFKFYLKFKRLGEILRHESEITLIFISNSSSCLIKLVNNMTV